MSMSPYKCRTKDPIAPKDMFIAVHSEVSMRSEKKEEPGNLSASK